MYKAKPFVKWVGGKRQLIAQIGEFLPSDFQEWKEVTYIEPFVGGGAMLFHLLQAYPNITTAIINDLNKDLIGCYEAIRDYPEELILSLQQIEVEYLSLPEEKRKEFFMKIRTKYNEKNFPPIENTTMFLFLNRTCFNGLYRENKSGFFNVPFGQYRNPKICDPSTIRSDSQLLQRVKILHGDFSETFAYAQGKTLFYFDPPYRPLSNTSSFNDYTKESFKDDEQIRLKMFCDKVHEAGHLFLLSNSDCKSKDEEAGFFDTLYAQYKIERIFASRNINSNPQKRGKLTEILVRNYPNTKECSKSNLSQKKREKMRPSFETFMAQLQETNQTLDFFCDFEKIQQNVENIKLSLCILNSLIGAPDLRESIKTIWERDRKAFLVMDILIALRSTNNKKILTSEGNSILLNSYFESIDGVLEYLEKTGLADIFRTNRIKDLVDYVFGIETGLDTNARKNRSGVLMENIVERILIKNEISYRKEVYSHEWEQVRQALGKDEKRFDFVVPLSDKTYLIEVNFYSSAGSKLNEVARSYSDIAPKINALEGFEFVWITDGVGWQSARNKLQEAYSIIPNIYNLTNISELIALLKH